MAESYALLELTGSAEELEIATALLHDHGCLGTEDADGSLRAYFSGAVNVHALADELGHCVPSLACRIAEPVPSRDWLAEWKAELEGFSLGSRYFVLPTWKPDVETDRTVLRIDPEQAFGTGTHETTQLCVELIEDYVTDGMSVLDVGTGTGILAMVAAHEGAASVRAFDVDPAAVECARTNIERNGLASTIDVECASWSELGAMRADVVVANINAAILKRAMRSMYGIVLLSGILTAELAELALPARAVRLETRSAGEWSALAIRHE